MQWNKYRVSGLRLWKVIYLSMRERKLKPKFYFMMDLLSMDNVLLLSNPRNYNFVIISSNFLLSKIIMQIQEVFSNTLSESKSSMFFKNLKLLKIWNCQFFFFLYSGDFWRLYRDLFSKKLPWKPKILGAGHAQLLISGILKPLEFA